MLFAFVFSCERIGNQRDKSIPINDRRKTRGRAVMRCQPMADIVPRHAVVTHTATYFLMLHRIRDRVGNFYDYLLFPERNLNADTAALRQRFDAVKYGIFK